MDSRARASCESSSKRVRAASSFTYNPDDDCSWDGPTKSFVQHLHNIWSHQAPPAAYAKLRDALLSHQDQLDTNILTLCSVAKIACPFGLDGDTQWLRLLTLGRNIESDAKKRKRCANETGRLRNLALVASLWSPEVVFYYGWDKAGQVQMSAIRTCAVQYPRFWDDLAPRLNCLLLERHREGIMSHRRKNLVEAPLQPLKDLNVQLLAATSPNKHAVERWITSQDGSVTVNDDGQLLNVVRPNHYHMYLLQKDRYGLIAARTSNSEHGFRTSGLSPQSSCSTIPSTAPTTPQLVAPIESSTASSVSTPGDSSLQTGAKLCTPFDCDSNALLGLASDQDHTIANTFDLSRNIRLHNLHTRSPSQSYETSNDLPSRLGGSTQTLDMQTSSSNMSSSTSRSNSYTSSSGFSSISESPETAANSEASSPAATEDCDQDTLRPRQLTMAGQDTMQLVAHRTGKGCVEPGDLVMSEEPEDHTSELINPASRLDITSTSTLPTDGLSRNKQRMILLQQDDVLLLPTGLKVVRTANAPTTTAMEGGVLWHEYNVVSALHGIDQTN